MTDREKLIELLCDAPLGSKTFEQQYYKSTITKMADYLITKGVRVSKEINLAKKCGSCDYAVPELAYGNSISYVRCTNEEHTKRYCKTKLSELRQRTAPACKMYSNSK